VTVSAELSDPAPLPLDPARVQANFDALTARVRAALADQELDFTSVVLRREVDARYGPQICEVTTPVAEGAFDEAAVAAIGEAFEAQYARQFGEGTGYREAGIEVITYRVHGVGTLPVDPELPRPPAPAAGVEEARKGSRPVFLDVTHGWADTAVYDYRALGPGHVITGPAVVEVPTTTVVIPAGAEGHVDGLGNLDVRLP
ncbi:hydantoinase/oxoprolinase family protein, partial [Streptosporangium algeriense]